MISNCGAAGRNSEPVNCCRAVSVVSFLSGSCVMVGWTCRCYKGSHARQAQPALFLAKASLENGRDTHPSTRGITGQPDAVLLKSPN